MSSRLVFLLVALVAAWVLAFNTGHSLAYSVAYLVTGALAFSYLWAHNGVRGVQVVRVNKTLRSQVGQFAEEHMEVINRSRWPKLWLELDDESTLPWHTVARVVTVGRRIVLGEQTEEELETTIEHLPAGSLQSGFYSYGEISSTDARRCDMHNMTLTLTSLTEA